ncbi:MAG: T9SS type A sorting domain-containing protein [Bacteroidales bacterium]|jgi:spore germination protein YaaH|nr:T9SS type A sorting domain-containing protein [Bacteroidales bacterium]
MNCDFYNVAKKISYLFLFLFVFIFSFSQNQDFKSIHQTEIEYYNSLNKEEEDFRQMNIPTNINMNKSVKSCNLNKIVFGWHPYWSAGLEANYDWSALSDFTFFSYEVNATTGNAANTHSWATSAAVTTALSHEIRVNLCVTLFSDHATFFASSSSQQTLITNLINAIQSRGAHGINIDFEGVPSSCSIQFNNFLVNLSTQMHNANPNFKVSVCLYAVDWNNIFDETLLDQYIDYYTLMGYDYYYSGSTIAGPTAPLYTFNAFDYNIAKSVNYYISQGISREKLILGIPYYGQEWSTSNQTIPSATTSSGASRTYLTIKTNSSGYYSSRQFDSISVCPYYVFNNGSAWKQCFCDDEISLAVKYDFVNMLDIAGVGIWALGYDDGYTELWDIIKEKFTDCRINPCSGVFYDLGGPDKFYFNNSDYSFTISPDGASQVILEFPIFDIEAGSGTTCNYDYLEIFDGNSITAPSLGRFCNSIGNPGTIISTGNAITLKFHSDGATVNAGFKGVWNCISDNENPVTEIIADEWQSESFEVNFTDTDNEDVNLKFYQVLDNDGSEWRANQNFGFFNDNFTSEIHSDWVNLSGLWLVEDGNLLQTDEITSNENFYTNVMQNSQNEYLYHWQMKLSGSGNNRRAGIYFFCDNPTLTYHGNSYMVYFRADVNKCQIYKIVNNVIGDPVTNDNVVVNPNTWYDYKVIYNPNTGVIKTYQNNILVSQWLDANPLQNGNSIALRTGGCIAAYDDIKVYKSRVSSEIITVGENSEVRYQNQNFNSPACRIESIITDVAGHFSDITSLNVNIDRTAPEPVLYVYDGEFFDVDTVFSNFEISANWASAFEPNSQIVEYQYCIGTSPEQNDIKNWTSCGLNNAVTISELNLLNSLLYYVSVRAKNTVNMFSGITSSDGFVVENPIINNKIIDSPKFEIFPNPVSDYFEIKSDITNYQIEIFNISGIKIFEDFNNKIIDVSSFISGVYTIKFSSQNNVAILLLIVN